MHDPLWDWKDRVPEGLLPAVEHIRKTFERANWRVNWITRDWCYAALHPNEPEKVKKAQNEAVAFDQLKVWIGAPALQQFQELIKRNTPSATLKAFFNMYVKALSKELVAHFRDLLEIGSAHRTDLSVPPIEWAAWQTKSMTSCESRQVAHWLKSCCDIQQYAPNSFSEDEYLWLNWQAPKFVLMEPCLGMRYDAARVWEREGIEMSLRVAERFTEMFVIGLKAQLRKCEGEAQIEAAKKIPQPSLTIEQVGALALTFTWKELVIRFQDLHEKTKGQSFSATFIGTESDSVSGEWILGGNAVWRNDFEELASVAARKLGYRPSEDANKYWLDRVRKWMQQTGLDKDKSVGLLSAAQDLLIERIAEWSAKFCRNLMLRGTPESAAPLREASSEAKEPLVTAEASPDGVATQEHVPSSAEVPESRKAGLLRRLTAPKPAGYFRTQQAAEILDVSPRTINRMVSDSRLKKGTTRGTVTAISVKHVYEDTFGKLD